MYVCPLYDEIPASHYEATPARCEVEKAAGLAVAYATVSQPHAQQLVSESEAEDLLRTVWDTEGKKDPLRVTVYQGNNFVVPTPIGPYAVAGLAMWHFDPAIGELYAQVEIASRYLNRMVLLHEMTHLLIDTMAVLQGHNKRWLDRYTQLIGANLSLAAASQFRNALDLRLNPYPLNIETAPLTPYSNRLDAIVDAVSSVWAQNGDEE